MMKIKLSLKIVILLLIFLFVKNDAFAGGPATSDVYLFCTLKNTADLHIYEPTIEEKAKKIGLRPEDKCSIQNNGVKACYREYNIIFRTSPEHFENLMRSLGKLGTPFTLGSSQMDTHSSPLGTVEYRNIDFLDYNLGLAEKSCEEDVSSIEKLIKNKTDMWHKFMLSDDFYTGNTFVIAPYTEENEKVIRGSDFDDGEPRYLRYSEENGWIFAYTVDSFFKAYIEYFLAIILVGIGLLVYRMVRFFRRRSRQ